MHTHIELSYISIPFSFSGPHFLLFLLFLPFLCLGLYPCMLCCRISLCFCTPNCLIFIVSLSFPPLSLPFLLSSFLFFYFFALTHLSLHLLSFSCILCVVLSSLILPVLPSFSSFVSIFLYFFLVLVPTHLSLYLLPFLNILCVTLSLHILLLSSFHFSFLPSLPSAVRNL